MNVHFNQIKARAIILLAAGILVTILYPETMTAEDKQPCDNKAAPVVFVHGFLGSGDTWAPQVQRFVSNGVCHDRFFAFDWNSTGGGAADLLLEKFIDSVLVLTGAEKVHLAGHSAGGGR